MKLLELEIDRLRADLGAAEQALVAVESGMRGGQTRAEAVSMLAEARIEVDRAQKRAPWRGEPGPRRGRSSTRRIASSAPGTSARRSSSCLAPRGSRPTLLAEADLVKPPTHPAT